MPLLVNRKSSWCVVLSSEKVEKSEKIAPVLGRHSHYGHTRDHDCHLGDCGGGWRPRWSRGTGSGLLVAVSHWLLFGVLSFWLTACIARPTTTLWINWATLGSFEASIWASTLAVWPFCRCCVGLAFHWPWSNCTIEMIKWKVGLY